MYGVRIEKRGVGVAVGMSGEFDICSLPGLRGALDEACASGEPVAVDLSGVTFLDLRSARELVVRSVIGAHQLSFENPSPGVLASVRALGLEDGSPIGAGSGEPPVFSEA